MAALETVDLDGVEILSTGGPVFGQGSPPEGDFWTTDDLRAMALADSELGEELKPPAKIGHSDQQTLVRNSNLPAPLPGEMPAVGWLENLRVSDDGTKLLADVKAMPRKLADLIESGAYRTRSVELSKVTSQATGKVYDWVVTGLAWLGGKLPAVRTLDDVAALYEADGVELIRVVSYAAGDVVWSPTEGFHALRAAVDEALNGVASEGMVDERFWVRDVTVSKALVGDYYQGDDRDAWIVPFTQNPDGSVTVAARDQWVKADQAWLQSAKEYEAAFERATGKFHAPADTRPGMADATYTDEQRRKFAEATGLAADKVTDELLAASGVAAEQPAPPEPDPPPTPPAEATKALEARVEKTERDLAEAREETRLEKRRAFVEQVLRDGKAQPSQRASIETLFDQGEEAARKFFDEQPVNDDWVREYGSDQDDSDLSVEEQRDLEERTYADEAAARLGISKEALL